MTPAHLTIRLLSETTFGRREGTAGEVDVEIEHDDLGLPLIRGKTLRGLMRDAWLTMAPAFPGLDAAAARYVLGVEADLGDTAILSLGNGLLVGAPDAAGLLGDPRPWVEHAIRERRAVGSHEVLAALTGVRHQTAEARDTGAPRKHTLRASRTALRGLVFRARLDWSRPPVAAEVRCLALIVLGVRHAGLGRNRGRGHIEVSLDGHLERTQSLARTGAA